MAINGVAVGITVTGAVFLYSGLTNKSVLSVIQNVITGKTPETAKASAEATTDTAEASAAPLTSTSGTTSADFASTTYTGASGTLSSAQVGALWEQYGGNPAKTTYAQGVVNAESGGNPLATSSNPDGGTNVGLYQLDTRGVGSGYSVAQLQNPATNTQITIMATKNGTDWAEWADPFVDQHGTGGNI
jgi:hypothetical protein